ncbi:MAG: NAD(+)/NADH kinase [Sedimentisphaerales bacterium]
MSKAGGKNTLKLAIFGDRRKPNVAETISEFSNFIKNKATTIVNCGIDECTFESLKGADFAIVFGGDGSIISAARQLSRTQVPVVGVNVGKLGYLAEFSVEELKNFFPRLKQGDTQIEKRMMLLCRVMRNGDERFRSSAVNDVFITAGPPFRMIELKMSVDNQHLSDCVSDGLVVATPTGSTAYSLSAGGPVLSSIIEVRGVRLNDGTTVSIDGQVSLGLEPNDIVRVQREQQDFLVVNNPLRNEWDTLATKLGWAEKPKYQPTGRGKSG